MMVFSGMVALERAIERANRACDLDFHARQQITLLEGRYSHPHHYNQSSSSSSPSGTSVISSWPVRSSSRLADPTAFQPTQTNPMLRPSPRTTLSSRELPKRPSIFYTGGRLVDLDLVVDVEDKFLPETSTSVQGKAWLFLAFTVSSSTSRYYHYQSSWSTWSSNLPQSVWTSGLRLTFS